MRVAETALAVSFNSSASRAKGEGHGNAVKRLENGGNGVKGIIKVSSKLNTAGT